MRKPEAELNPYELEKKKKNFVIGCLAVEFFKSRKSSNHL